MEPLNDNTEPKPLFTGLAYDRMKTLVQVILPGISTFYFTMSNIWGWPREEQVIGTLAAFAVFLGLLLGQSNRRYKASDAQYDGKIVVTTKEDGTPLVSLELNGDPYDIIDMKSANFKVQPIDRAA